MQDDTLSAKDLQRLLFGWPQLMLKGGELTVEEFCSLEEQADKEGLACIGLFLLKKGVPDELKQRQKDEFLRNALYLSLLHRFSCRMYEHGISFIALKGASLLLDGYPLGMRPLSDVDIVVRPEHKKLALEVEQQILTEHSELAGYILDVHTDPTGRVGPAFRFSEDELWQRARPAGDRYPGCYLLEVHDNILQLCVHAVKHSFERWIWVVDLMLLLPKADPYELVRRARELNALRPLGYVCRLLDFSLPVTLELNQVERWFLGRVASRTAPVWSGKAVITFSIPGLVPKLAYLWNLAFGELAFSGRPTLRQLWRRVRRWMS